jgi:fumarate reductase subunit C
VEEGMNPNYKLHHPKWHRPRTPIFWWLEKLRFTKFILRELTSLAVCYAVVLLLLQIAALSRGSEAHEEFLAFLQRPPILAVNVLVLLGLLFHTVTWLNLAPRALVLRFGPHRVPASAILAGHYLAWLAVTVVIVWGLVGR